jgi:hypothetical protein
MFKVISSGVRDGDQPSIDEFKDAESMKEALENYTGYVVLNILDDDGNSVLVDYEELICDEAH